MELISSASIAAKPDKRHQNVDLRIKVRTPVRDKLTTSVSVVKAGHSLLHSLLQ